MDTKQTVQAFVHAINSQDWSRLDSLVATDFVRHSIAAGDPPVRSRSDLVMFLRREFEICPDAQEIVLEYLLKAKKLPTPEQFAQVMSEAQQDYVRKLRKLREKD